MRNIPTGPGVKIKLFFKGYRPEAEPLIKRKISTIMNSFRIYYTKFSLSGKIVFHYNTFICPVSKFLTLIMYKQ